MDGRGEGGTDARNILPRCTHSLPLPLPLSLSLSPLVELHAWMEGGGVEVRRKKERRDDDDEKEEEEEV